ncbi:MAG TPA: hypothetical protein VF054_14470 [Micromonosporaceae bacterium]
MKAKLRILSVAAAAMVVISAATGAAYAVPTTQPAVFKIDGTADAVLISEAPIGHGAWVASWAVGQATVKVAGMPGLTVHVDAAHAADPTGSVAVSVTARHIDRTTMLAQRTSYTAGGYLAYDEALAAGFTPGEASNVVQVHAVGPSYAPGDIYDSWCVDTTGDSGYAWGHGCVVQKIIQMNGGDWYLGDQISGTANDQSGFNTGNSLEAFRVRDDYPSGNTVVQYNPTGTVSTGSCTTFTPSLTYDGVTVSASANLCADNEQPSFNGSIGYGAKWNGCDGFEQDEGVSAVSVIHSPSGASVSATLYVTIWWGSFC